ncbi:MAG: pyridoxamine 5'-phosphate oxidase family protein [Rhodospirillales bacterium]
MDDFSVTERTKVRRKPQRGHYDRETVYAILDEALYCHVAIVEAGKPVVVPTAHWRSGDRLYLHGSKMSRLLRALSQGVEACVAATLIDGVVLARSGFHSSVNYRSVLVFGRAEAVPGRAGKEAAMRSFMESLAPGRWDELRPPTKKEIDATTVVMFALDEASAKVREGPPVDDETDYAADVWAGVVPLALVRGEPVPDPRLKPGIAPPAYLDGRGRL